MIQSVHRAMDILEAMSQENRKYSVAEIAAATKANSSTVHHFLTTMVSRGLVAKDEKAKLYYLGPALISLGNKAAEQMDLRTIAAPIMSRLSELTGEDIYLVIRIGYRGVVVEHILGSHPIKYVNLPGNEAELHSGAIRKTLLAYQSDEFIDEYIKRSLARYTENTTIDEETLRQDLTRIKENGYAVTHAEYIDSVYGFGAPIFNASNQIAAAVGIIAPDIRISEANKYDLAVKVKMCAIEISNHLGCSMSLLV